MSFSSTSPSRNDSDNNLLFKIAQAYATICPASGATPMLGDSDNTLLSKWVKSVATCGTGGTTPAPARGDYDNTLLFKLATLLYQTDTVVYAAVQPRMGDSDSTLLFKICRYYSGICLSADSGPQLGDSDNTLLFKIAKTIEVCPISLGEN